MPNVTKPQAARSKSQGPRVVSSEVQPHRRSPLKVPNRVSCDEDKRSNRSPTPWSPDSMAHRKPVCPVSAKRAEPVIGLCKPVQGARKEPSKSEREAEKHAQACSSGTNENVKPLMPVPPSRARAVQGNPQKGNMQPRISPSINHCQRKKGTDNPPPSEVRRKSNDVLPASDRKAVEKSKDSAAETEAAVSVSVRGRGGGGNAPRKQEQARGKRADSASNPRPVGAVERKSTPERIPPKVLKEAKKGRVVVGVAVRGVSATPLKMRQQPPQAQPIPLAIRNPSNRQRDPREFPNAPFLKFFREKVALSQEEICKTSELVNDVVSGLLEEVRSIDPRFAMRILNAGSYYEHLKVSRPSEFDVMLVFDAHQMQRFFTAHCPSRPQKLGELGYAQLKFQDSTVNGREKWGEFLTEDENYLCPPKLLSHFYQLVEKAVRDLRKRKRSKRVLKLSINGPAVTMAIGGKVDVDFVLSIEVVGWPECANGWGNFASRKTWPTQSQVEQIKMNEPKYHLVAKPCPCESVPKNCQKNWRVSFSEAEKALLKPTDPTKKCYRVAKRIFEAHKPDLKPLSSYHLKTLFLRLRQTYPRGTVDDSNLGEEVVQFLKSLVDVLKEGSLWHFFVSRLNLFSEMTDKEKGTVACKLAGCISKLVGNPEHFLEHLHSE